MAMFEPGLALAAAFYGEVLEPTLTGITHAAGLLGWGSDVLGFDTERSTDHGWGPRAQIFVDAEHLDGVSERVEAILPTTFRGWPTRFGWDDTPSRHHVEVTTVPDWLGSQLGFVPEDQIPLQDWLLAPQQLLLGVTAGAVFRDDRHELRNARSQLTWYPDQVWLWLLACQWRRIAQEEALVGRMAEVGDELGSRLVTARLARDVVRLCFLLEQRYAPYNKWLGTAFARLDAAREVGPALERVLAAADHAEREGNLVAAYEAVAIRHNGLGITERVDPVVRQFHNRPYRVLCADRFVTACRERLHDREIRALPLVGAVDQFADSTDVLSRAERARLLRAVLEEPARADQARE